MAKPCPDLCSLRSEEGAHIGGKRFFQESLKADYWASELFFFLWGQKPPISNAQESAWPQRYHFQLFTKYISQNFSHGFCGFSQLFFFQYPTQKIHTDLLQEMFFSQVFLIYWILISISQESAKPQSHFLQAFTRNIFTIIFQIFPQMSNIYESVDHNVAFLVQKKFSPFLLFADFVKLISSISKTRVSLTTTFITLMLRLHFQYFCQLQRAQS